MVPNTFMAMCRYSPWELWPLRKQRISARTFLKVPALKACADAVAPLPVLQPRQLLHRCWTRCFFAAGWQDWPCIVSSDFNLQQLLEDCWLDYHFRFGLQPTSDLQQKVGGVHAICLGHPFPGSAWPSL